jgi:hypothetical protein
MNKQTPSVHRYFYPVAFLGLLLLPPKIMAPAKAKAYGKISEKGLQSP